MTTDELGAPRTHARRETVTVTVIIPTHNRCTLLRSAIASALSQMDVELEIVVVDDGSGDGTAEMLASIADPRVRVIRNDIPEGVSAARNRGIEEARGPWLAFLDDDDLWAPDKLRSQLEAARRGGRRWCYAGHVNVDLRNRVTGGEPPLPPNRVAAELQQSDVVPGGCSGVIVTKELLRESGPFDASLQPLADWDLWLRLARIEPPTAVSRPLVAYRIQPKSMSMNTARVLSEFEILARRYGEGNRAILYRYLGWWSLRGGHRRDAIRFFARGALQRRPEYRVRDLVGDAMFVAGNRLGPRTLVGRLLQRRSTTHQDHRGWKAEGQAWIDALRDVSDGGGFR
jgi:glycosyltransferase involved in cell wall biosynthesis